MPFGRKGAAGLTERLDVRMAPGEKEQLRVMVRAAVLAYHGLDERHIGVRGGEHAGSLRRHKDEGVRDLDVSARLLEPPLLDERPQTVGH